MDGKPGQDELGRPLAGRVYAAIAADAFGETANPDE